MYAKSPHSPLSTNMTPRQRSCAMPSSSDNSADAVGYACIILSAMMGQEGSWRECVCTSVQAFFLLEHERVFDNFVIFFLLKVVANVSSSDFFRRGRNICK